MQEDLISYIKEWMGQDYSQVEHLVTGVSFDKLLDHLSHLNTGGWNEIWSMIQKSIKLQWDMQQDCLFQLFLLGVLSAFFVDFSNTTLKNYIGETGFFAIYTISLTLLLESFQSIYTVAVGSLEIMFEAVRCILPVFLAGLLLSGNVTTAFSQSTFLVFSIGMVEWVCEHILFPAMYFYFVIQMLDYCMKETKFSKFSDVIKKSVIWILRLLFGLITGMQVVQCLLTPATDQAKNSNFSRSLAAIPGLGASARALTSTLFQSSNVLKNTIGVAGMLLILCAVLAPLIQLLLYILSYQLLAAVLQPIAKDRIAGLYSAVSSSAKLMFQGSVTCTILFLVNLVIVTAATQGVS